MEWLSKDSMLMWPRGRKITPLKLNLSSHLSFPGREQMKRSKAMQQSWWRWSKNMRDTRIFGGWTSTTATLLGRLKTIVSGKKMNKRFLLFVLAAKRSLDLHLVHIYFDTSTFDQVEKDVKVTKKQNMPCISKQCLLISGDSGGSIGFDWRDNGTLHWLLNPQWHWDSLLCCKVLSDENWETI